MDNFEKSSESQKVLVVVRRILAIVLAIPTIVFGFLLIGLTVILYVGGGIVKFILSCLTIIISLVFITGLISYFNGGDQGIFTLVIFAVLFVCLLSTLIILVDELPGVVGGILGVLFTLPIDLWHFQGKGIISAVFSLSKQIYNEKKVARVRNEYI